MFDVSGSIYEKKKEILIQSYDKKNPYTNSNFQ